MNKLNFNEYTIISNTCLGGFIYRDLNRQFDNPFIWNMWNNEIIYDFLINFSNINFNNFTINKTYSQKLEGRVSNVFKNTNRNIYSIIIDKKYEIYYPHFIEIENQFTPIKSKSSVYGIDLLYYNITEYLINLYTRRINRMKKYKPLFILDTIIEDDIVKKLIDYNFSFPIICGSKTIYFNNLNKIIYTYPKQMAQDNSKEIIKNFNNYNI